MYNKNKYQNKTLRERTFYFGKCTNASIKAPQRYGVQVSDTTMPPHSKNAGAKIKHSITIAKPGCLIFTPHMVSPILTYNATEIIFENAA